MLAVLTTHPIQYQAPIWRAIAARGRIPFKVYYLSDRGQTPHHDPGFGRIVSWDIDLLGGYDHSFVKAVASSKQSSFGGLRLAEDVALRARREGAEVLWLQGWQVAAYWQAVWQARMRGLELWVRGDTNLRSTGLGSFVAPKRWLQSNFLRFFKECLYVGEANRNFYIARGVPAERLTFAPHCVENQRFQSQASALRPERAKLRARWSIPDDAFCVLFMGKLVGRKRPLDLVDAVKALGGKVQGRQVHILFVGTGELDGALRDACTIVHDASAPEKRSGSSAGPNASFAGFLNQSEVAAAYVAADGLILPSESSETWGLVVNEAMACGLPTIVSDACGCSDDLVRPFRPDLCFPVGDIHALGKSLASLIERPPGASDLSNQIAKYDIMRTVENVENLFLAGRRSALGA